MPDIDRTTDLQTTATAARALGDHAAERAALDELALRERTAARGADGPDQGDPAAPVLWGVEGITAAHPPVIRTVLTTLEEASQVAQRLGGTVVPLYRAPGAVAAAPPGDEEAEYAADAVFPLHVGRHTPWERNHAREVWNAFRAQARRTLREGAVTGGDDSGHDYTTEDARNAHERRTARAPDAVADAPPGDEVDPAAADDALADDLATLLSAVGGATAHDLVQAIRDAGWRPAPPAGREDEAAVERAALIDRALAAPEGDDEHHPAALVKGPTTESGWLTRACSCEEFAWPCPYWLLNENARLRAALAAARGPRTPDPGASA